MRPADAALPAIVDVLTNRLAEQEARVALLEQRRSMDTRARDVNRRRLLAGGAMVALGGVAGLLGEAGPAAATNGDPIVCGNGTANTTTNSATALTQMNTNATGFAFGVANFDPSGSGAGIYGLLGGSAGIPLQGAVLGDTNVQGRHGVAGASAYGCGVYGFARDAGHGVQGVSSTGAGVAGQCNSSSASDLAASFSGWIHAKVQDFVGPPSGTANDYSAGEQIRDSAGQMWICVGNSRIVDGSVFDAGTWQKVAAVAPDANGGSLNLLPSPTRLYDSRMGQPGDIRSPQQQLAPGTSLPLTATGQGGIPSGAIGIVGTITVTNTAGAGYLALYPTGGSVPATSNVNWSASNQTIATSYACALDPQGSVTVYSGGNGPTDLIVDIAGYVY